MTETRKYADLRAQMTPEARARVDARVAETIRTLPPPTAEMFANAARHEVRTRLRDRFGIGPERAADEGFSEATIEEIGLALDPMLMTMALALASKYRDEQVAWERWQAARSRLDMLEPG